MTSAAALVSTGLTYRGARYVFGGAPGTVKGKDAGTDCSGFINMLVGRDLGQAIPGLKAGQYTGENHGPVVTAWASWTGATTLPKGSAPVAGDLAVWNGVGASGHIGLVVGPNKMVSALDTEQGTIESPIVGYGPAGVALTYRRINNLSGSAVIDSVPSGNEGALGKAGDFYLVPLLAGAGTAIGLLALVVGGTLAVGLLGAAGLALVARAAVPSRDGQ